MRDLTSLHRFLADRSAAPFEWGHDKNDCVSFAAAAVKAMTGSNPLAGLNWASEEEANKAQDAVGGIEAAVSVRLPEIPVALAKRGDVGAIPNGNGIILVIVEGDQLVAPAPRGLRRLPRRMMIKAWSVG